MAIEILAAESTDLFIGSEAEPRQVVRIVVRGGSAGGSGGSGPRSATTRIAVRGERVRSAEPVTVGPLAAGEEARLEVGVVVDGAVAGETIAAQAVGDGDGEQTTRAFDLLVAEPGWRMFMVAHFHYDPVWWNTQAAYTETWARTIAYRQPFQEPGLALVRAHLETARRDPLYKFVLAELDYLKPYWDAYPEDRDYVRQLFADGRLELVGGTYNEPNTNLTSAESTIRNAVYGVGYQRDVLGGAPATAWQLDVFGHDPQFPGIMADAGVTSSSWARGPFHEWGPHWVRGPARLPFAALASGEPPRMQFPTEFDWVAPSGRALLTSFMADHYSSGWWMDAAATLEEAEAQVHALFVDLAPLAATKNILLPVGTDYSPPNRWLTAMARDWNARFVWPKLVPAIPRDFFDAVRAERSKTGRGFSPQTRDMNPVYTGKDVSFIDTKQAQRAAENTLLAAEKFATIASLLGDRYPSEATDKAWRQLLFGAHHDGITGSESDQVYLDLLGGWREALELGRTALARALDTVGGRIDTSGDGLAVTVFNPLSWPRTDVVRAELRLPRDWGADGLAIRDDAGGEVPFVLEALDGESDGGRQLVLAFVAHDVPALGWRTYRAVPAAGGLDAARWRRTAGTSIENEAFSVSVDPARGGAITGILDRRSGRQLLRDGGLANEILACREYPNHPLFGEGPWHLTPDGRYESSADAPADVVLEESPIGRRLRVDAPFVASHRRQAVTVWDGVERIELTTRLDDFDGHDTLFRVRFAAAVEGGRSLSEVGNAVVGRPFGRPLVDVAEVPFTLDNPAYNWFALGSTARIELGSGGEAATADGARGARGRSLAFSVAEVIAPDEPAHDDAVRGLVVALVRSGVTSTLSTDRGARYGVLHIDSNLPDIRIAVGGPDANVFTAAVLDAAGSEYADEVRRQLAAGGARVLVPADPRPQGPNDPIPDRRGVRDLPVLIVAGSDAPGTTRALEAVTADLADSTIAVDQPADLTPGIGVAERATFAVLNRGLPSFNVEPDGSMYLSILRSCSGWPSGVWIDPPRRATPDGANFQFQHWSHDFEYAIAAAADDWRNAGTVRAGHEYNNPLVVRVGAGHDGDLPAVHGLVDVEPDSVVMTALKPAGNPLARMADAAVDAAGGVVLRLYESSGRRTSATIRTAFDIAGLERLDLLEETARPLEAQTGPAPSVTFDPFEIATIRLRPGRLGGDAAGTRGAPAAPADRAVGPAVEPAQPVFADYWMHNKGAAPIGYQPVSVGIRPWLLAGSGPFTIPVVVASERTDAATAGTVTIAAPDGWTADPPERVYRLAPGAHLAFDTVVTAPRDAAPGRYFVAARISDEAGQVHEDVVTIDLERDGPAAAHAEAGERSASLAESVHRALRGGEPVEEPTAATGARDIGGELTATIDASGVCVAPGDRATIRVHLRSAAASEIRGEVQLMSPHETWRFTTPWSQGFAVAAGGATAVTFDVAPSIAVAPGRWWALAKVMYFGRLLYTESVPVEVAAPAS